MMRRMDKIFPGYLLASHKGYSTPPHKKIIRESGQHLIIHRDSYLARLEAIEQMIGQEELEGEIGQQNLFLPEASLDLSKS